MRISVMRTIGVLALAAMLFASVSALAQFGGLLGTSRPTPAGSSYVGPLDAAGISATACYSLRACSASYATGSNYAITVRRASDNTPTNVLILSNGNLDVASAASFRRDRCDLHRNDLRNHPERYLVCVRHAARQRPDLGNRDHRAGLHHRDWNLRKPARNLHAQCGADRRQRRDDHGTGCALCF